MAVLAEGLSVIVLFDAIARLVDDEWAKFVALVPNQTLCCDNELARVGFMDANRLLKKTLSMQFATSLATGATFAALPKSST